MRTRNEIRIATSINPIERIWLTQKDAAKYLGVSIDFIKGLRLDGQLPYYSLGKLVFVKKDDIDRFIVNHKVI